MEVDRKLVNGSVEEIEWEGGKICFRGLLKLMCMSSALHLC